MISKKRFTIPFSQDCSNGWSMGRARLEFLPLLLCHCSKQSFCQGWWWCLQPYTGSWASPSISQDDCIHLEIYKCALSGEAVLLFVLFLSSWDIMLLYTIYPGARFWLSERISGVSDRCLECVWRCLLSRGRI